jgi:hypothetical protein
VVTAPGGHAGRVASYKSKKTVEPEIRPFFLTFKYNFKIFIQFCVYMCVNSLGARGWATAGGYAAP